MVRNPIVKPTSPYLFIYKAQLPAMLSIFHRISGIFLFLYWCAIVFLFSMSKYYESYFMIYALDYHFKRASFFLFTFFIVLPMFPLYYHLVNGLRHFFWDLGYGLGLNNVYKSINIVLIVSILLTIITYINI